MSFHGIYLKKPLQFSRHFVGSVQSIIDESIYSKTVSYQLHIDRFGMICQLTLLIGNGMSRKGHVCGCNFAPKHLNQ